MCETNVRPRKVTLTGMSMMYPMRMAMMMDEVTALEWRMLATAARRERVTRSPRAAAMGVATLSGLTE